MSANYVVPIFPGGISSQFKPSFDQAAAFWSRIITKGHSGYKFTSPYNTAQACGVSHTFPTGHTISGLSILAQVSPIDGPGKILGQAGPCLMLGNFPLVGIMTFDSADSQALLQSGQFGIVILHEMGHVIGIGSLWGSRGLVRNPCSRSPCTTNPTYTGANGIKGFQALGGSGSLLVGDENGPGTWNAHWREDEYDNEAMTGFLNSASPNPLSIMSIMSMIDLGYGVDTSRAEEYSLPNKLARPLGGVNYELVGEMLEFDRKDIRDEVERVERERGFKGDRRENEDESFTVLSMMIIGFILMAMAMIFSAKKQKKQINLLAQVNNAQLPRVMADKK